MQGGERLVRNPRFGGMFMAKIVEVRNTDVFQQNHTHLPPPEWFDRPLAFTFHCLGFRRLVETTAWYVANSLLEEFVAEARPTNELTYHMSCFLEHWIKSVLYRDSIDSLRQGFDRTLETSNATSSAPGSCDPWFVGAICRATWAGDGHKYYHDAKITWISRSRRSCRITYSNWDGWGWEETEYTVLMKNIVDPESDEHRYCSCHDERLV